MPNPNTLAMVVVVALASLAGCGEGSEVPAPGGVDAEAALDRFHERLFAVHRERDVPAYGRLHTQSVTFWWPGLAPITGRSDLEALMRDNWKDRAELDLTMDVAELSIHDDSAYEFGSYVESWRDPAGKHVTETGRYVTAYSLESDGEWRIARFVGFSDSTSSR